MGVIVFLTFDPSSLLYLRNRLTAMFEAAALARLEQDEAYNMADALLMFGKRCDYDVLRDTVGAPGACPLTSHALYVATMAASYALNYGLPPAETRALVCGTLFHNVGKWHAPQGDAAPYQQVGGDLLAASGFTDQAILSIVRSHDDRFGGRDHAEQPRNRRLRRLVRIVSICKALADQTEARGDGTPPTGPEAIRRLNAITPFYLDPMILVDVTQMIHRASAGGLGGKEVLDRRRA